MSMRILVAEDSINNQILIQKTLEKRGHSVNIVANGIEAVKAIDAFPYDLVFMDIQMPEMDGIEATAKIREFENPGKNSIPIIALTADAIFGAKEKYLDAGMNDYLKKPIDVKHLDRMLDQWGEKETDTSLAQNKAPSLPDSVQNNNKSVLNSEQFDQLANELGEEDLNNAYDVLWGNIREDIKNLSLAIQENKTNEIRSLAHKIKGTAASFAAENVSDCAYQIESNANDKRIIEEKVTELSELLLQAQDAVKTKLT